MMQYSLLDRRPEDEMLSFLKENHIGVLARGSIAKGLLVSKPAEDYLNYSSGQVAQAAAAVKIISGTTSSPLETSVQYVLKHPAVTSAVIGIRTEEQLREALTVREVGTTQKDQLENLSNVLPANKYTAHR
jgi:aryl-alcohol dehydrogenase-like predicted oxidoreductase